MEITGTDSPLELNKAEIVEIEEPQEEPPPETEPQVDETFPALLTLVQPALESEYMWRFDYGGNKIRASFTDEQYLERVSKREVGFFAGDTLRVRLRMRQWVVEGKKPTTEWTVVKVERHDHAKEPSPKLPFPSEGES